MLEFAVRILAAGLLILCSGWVGQPDFSDACKVSVFIACYAALAQLLIHKGRRDGWIDWGLAVADASAVAFLVILVRAPLPTALLAFLPLAIGYRLHKALSPTTNRGEDPILHPIPLPAPPSTIDAESYLALRENFRKLKDHHQHLEATSRRDHLAAQLLACKLPAGGRFYSRLAEQLQLLSGAKSLALYVFSPSNDLMSIRAVSGERMENLDDRVFPINSAHTARQISQNVDLTLRSLVADSNRSRTASIVLQHQQRIVGMMSIFASDFDELDRARRAADELADIAAGLIWAERKREETERRLRELELLYSISSLCSASRSTEDAMRRVIPELKALYDCDYVAAYLLDKEDDAPSAAEGREMLFFDAMRFGSGHGLDGWITAGTPEIAVFHPDEDPRCDATELLRRRVGSFIVMPLAQSSILLGYIVVGSRTSGGLGPSVLQSLRSVATELEKSLGRGVSASRGLLSPSEFQSIASAQKAGAIVILELLSKQGLLDTCGRYGLERGLTRFARAIHAHLPSGGALCRTRNGDFIVLLPNVVRQAAVKWANEIAAGASMIGVPASKDGRATPLAVQAKVADLSPQTDGVLA